MDLPRQEHQSLELWEVEFNYKEEVDLHLHLKNCPKNPNHINFIPIHQFSVDSLPPAYRDNVTVDFIQAMSDLTVLVSVKYVSMNRPETFPGSLKPYPLYANRGSHAKRSGTGWVDSVEIKSEECTCLKCMKSSKPSNEFARILIKTAAHVVYDDQEGAHTICHLFFDKGVKPDSSNGVITLTGMNRIRSSASIDWTEMVYITHDIKFAYKMYFSVNSWTYFRERVNLKYRNGPWLKEKISSSGEEETHTKHMMSIIVSHPHGCSKQVTIGKWVEKKSIDSDWCKYTYTTPTCPGSSGAHVFFLGLEWVNWMVKFCHWGVSEKELQLNESNFMREN